MSVKTSFEQVTNSVMGALIPGAGQPDILDTLHADHEVVQDLLERLTDSDNAREQKSLVGQIKQALIPHAKAEEQVVYDAIAALREDESKVEAAEGFTEHALASATLTQLDKLTPNTPEFKAAAKVLKELLSHHIKEEERDIWKQVKDNFSADQRERMNVAFLAAKKTIKIS